MPEVRGKSFGWRKINWKPERVDKDPVYKMLHDFLINNPQMSAAATIDLALCSLFRPYSDDARILFEADNIKLKPQFGFLLEDDAA